MGTPPQRPAASADDVARLAVLDHDLRRRLYDYVRSCGRPVTRDEAAAEAGISRNLAAFHLDKLVAARLLESGFPGPEEDLGPGRPPRRYRPAEDDVAVSIPERHYDLAGELLLEALLAVRAGAAPGPAVAATARDRGRELAGGSSRGERGARRRLVARLRDLGFEPYLEGGAVRLRNCPFHGLAVRSPELVCGMNRELLHGLLDGLGGDGRRAVLDPRPGECCVRIEPEGSR